MAQHSGVMYHGITNDDLYLIKQHKRIKLKGKRCQAKRNSQKDDSTKSVADPVFDLRGGFL